MQSENKSPETQADSFNKESVCSQLIFMTPEEQKIALQSYSPKEIIILQSHLQTLSLEKKETLTQTKENLNNLKEIITNTQREYLLSRCSHFDEKTQNHIKENLRKRSPESISTEFGFYKFFEKLEEIHAETQPIPNDAEIKKKEKTLLDTIGHTQTPNPLIEESINRLQNQYKRLTPNQSGDLPSLYTIKTVIEQKYKESNKDKTNENQKDLSRIPLYRLVSETDPKAPASINTNRQNMFLGILEQVIGYLNLNEKPETDSRETKTNAIQELQKPIPDVVKPIEKKEIDAKKEHILKIYTQIQRHPDITIRLNDFEKSIKNLPANTESENTINNIESFFVKALAGDILAQKAIEKNLSLKALTLLNINRESLTITPNEKIYLHQKTVIDLTSESIIQTLEPESLSYEAEFKKAILDSASNYKGHPYARIYTKNGPALANADSLRTNNEGYYTTYNKKLKRNVQSDKMPMVCARFVTETLKTLGIDTSGLLTITGTKEDPNNQDRTWALELWAEKETDIFYTQKLVSTTRQNVHKKEYIFEVGDIITINKNKSVRHIGIVTGVDDKGLPLTVMDSSGSREGVYEVPFNQFGSSDSSIDRIIRIKENVQKTLTQ